ncbi:MAG: CDP-alcohol phosphatidyltransferase family protein [Gracilimonas sp.]
MLSRGFFDDYERSIKNKTVEEGFDLVFSRPLGFIIAKILSKLHFTPTGISVFGMLIGVTGGTLFYWQDSLLYTAIGGLLVIIAGVFDSADGQAARLYNTHSEMGRYLDMFNDMLVFISCYAAGIFYFADTYTVLGCIAIGLVSGYVHSLKSNIYEYYKGEFLHFSGTDSNQRNDSIDYIKENFDRSTLLRKLTYPVLIDYVRRQNNNKFRDDAVTEIFEDARDHDPIAFKHLYEEKSRNMLAGWAWVCGSNIMRNAIIISCLFGRFDIYAFLNIASYLLFLYVGRLQNKVDQNIVDELKSWDLNSVNEMNLQLQK